MQNDTLDPRPITEILHRLDALAPGEALELDFPDAPEEALRALQSQRPGGFDWSVLEREGGRHRVEVRRRDPSEPRSVTGYLTWDHRRLDGIFEDVKRRVADGTFDAAQARFRTFADGLDHHIDMEERILFPAFEEATGMTAGPTQVMRVEHARIRVRLGEIATALAGRDRGAFSESAEALVALLGAHNAKEEGILYPMSDRVAGDERGREEMVERMQSV